MQILPSFHSVYVSSCLDNSMGQNITRLKMVNMQSHDITQNASGQRVYTFSILCARIWSRIFVLELVCAYVCMLVESTAPFIRSANCNARYVHTQSRHTPPHRDTRRDTPLRNSSSSAAGGRDIIRTTHWDKLGWVETTTEVDQEYFG